jgi:hypothetical protein
VDLEQLYLAKNSPFARLGPFSCLSILHNAVVAWNMMQMDTIVAQLGPPAAITGFFTVRRVPWIMLWTVFSVSIN